MRKVLLDGKLLANESPVKYVGQRLRYITASAEEEK